MIADSENPEFQKLQADLQEAKKQSAQAAQAHREVIARVAAERRQQDEEVNTAAAAARRAEGRVEKVVRTMRALSCGGVQ